MRTTIRLNEELLQRAKKRAADEGRTFTSLVEEALTIILSPQKYKKEWIDLPVSKASGGVQPGVDLNRACDLEEIMNTP
jgi:Bacterial antitoxin of type II TA system, VapB